MNHREHGSFMLKLVSFELESVHISWSWYANHFVTHVSILQTMHRYGT